MMSEDDGGEGYFNLSNEIYDKKPLKVISSGRKHAGKA